MLSYEPEPCQAGGRGFFKINFSSILPIAASRPDRRPDENGPLTSSSESGRRSRAGRSGRPQRQDPNIVTARRPQTECVFQTPIRAGHKGRDINHNPAGLPFSATWYTDFSAPNITLGPGCPPFAASVTSLTPHLLSRYYPPEPVSH